jgi:hypothetical protein
MYVFTGTQVYRDNAMKILRIWQQMDPAKYAEFADSHIHTGIPIQRMMTAAELLRYGSCATDAMPWTDADTTALTQNLVTPVIETFQHDQNHFMNQHTYPLIGAMAGYIFTDDAPGYEESVEWFTVNATATDQGFNGSISRLFRLVERDDATGEPLAEPRVQHVEMGRDQAHGGGDITNAYILARMMMAQGTTVDPTDGTVSTAADAVGPYEFLDDRILAAADYFWQFMLGYETPWTPVGYAISPDGTIRDTYDQISNQYRGRFNTAGFWDLYYYYTYERGLDVEAIAPHLAEAFSKRLPPDYFYRGTLTRAWDNVDAGGDFWLYLPAGAAGSSVPSPQANPKILEVEERYTHIDGSSTTQSSDGTTFVRLTGPSPSKIAFLNGSTTQKRIALRVRTDGEAQLNLSFGLDRSILLPDTGGSWQYVVVDLTGPETINDLLYLEASGTATVDIDHISVDAASMTPPTMRDTPARVVAVTGEEVTADLAPEDAGGNVTSSATHLPAGAVLSASTGELRWTPTQAGTADVLLAAADGTAISAKRVALTATADRPSALQAASAGFDEAATYTAASSSAYDAARAAAESELEGAAGEFAASLAALVAATDALELVSPETPRGSLDYPALLASSTAGTNALLLVDGDNQTGTTYGQAVDLSHTFDFGPFAKVSATQFGLRSNNFEDRLANSAVFGSNDGTTWTRLTPEVTTMTQAYQTLAVAPEHQNTMFQYIKVQILEPVPDVLYGTVRSLFEITEFDIYGERKENVGDIEHVTLSAPGTIRNRVVPGETVALGFRSSGPISDVRVTLAGVPASATTADGTNWTASAPLPAGLAPGARVPFSLEHVTGGGQPADPVLTTSDGSSLYASTNDGVVDSALRAATVIGLDGNTTAAMTAEAARLFDSNAATHSDTRPVNGRASLEWDLGEGTALAIAGVDVLVRQDQYGTSRLSTLRFEGSNDRTVWTPLTGSVRGTLEWQRLESQSNESFRYIRLTNGNIMNIAETRVFGEVVAHDGSEAPPAQAAIHSDNGWDDGILDGDYHVGVNLWWGENARRIVLFENGVQVDDITVESNSPQAQSASFDIAARPNGDYTYVAHLINSTGTTVTQPLTVHVAAAHPGTPVLSTENSDGDGDFTVTADLWWGTNADSFTFFENGAEVHSGSLTRATPAAQRATLVVSDRPVGTYVYTVVFTNAAGEASSTPLVVKVNAKR